MAYHELLQLYFERSNALQSYWTVYVVVIGGLLAFSSLRKDPDLITTLLISILFLFFAYKNLGAIEDVSLQRVAVLQGIVQAEASTDPVAAEFRQRIEPTLIAPEINGIKQFHWASDLLTLAALWAMERRRRRSGSRAA